MFKRFMPRVGKFFDLFEEIAAIAVKAAQEFTALISDLKNAEAHVRNIKNLEHDADEVTHKTIALLHTVFITPIDREDIRALIKKLDDVIDFIDAASQRIALYNIQQSTPEAHSLALICEKSVERVSVAVKLLKNLKDQDQITKECVEINRLENEADQILRAGIAKLFREEQDTRLLIKLKEIYELLETVTDHCEDVANIIEGIVLEYA